MNPAWFLIAAIWVVVLIGLFGSGAVEDWWEAIVRVHVAAWRWVCSLFTKEAVR